VSMVEAIKATVKLFDHAIATGAVIGQATLRDLRERLIISAAL